MGGPATSRERQAALRASRRQAGLKYIHVWVSPEQAQAIKAYLVDPLASPLHVTRQTQDDQREEDVRRRQFDLQVRLNDVQQRSHDLALAEMALESQRRDLEARENRIDEKRDQADSAYETFSAWQEEADQRLKAIRQREDELDTQERRLKSAGARLDQAKQNRKVTDKARTEALIQRFTTRRDYSQPNITVTLISESYEIERRAQEITKLTTKTRAVSTALNGLVREFRDLLGDREIADLEDAVAFVHRIGEAAAVAKQTTLAAEKSIKAAEQARYRQAHQAAEACLAGLDERDVLLHVCILNPSQYKLNQFLSRKPIYQSMTELLAEVHLTAVSNMRYQIEKQLKSGERLEEAKAAVLAKLAERMPGARITYGPKLDEAIAAVVAERLEAAHGNPSSP